VENDHPRPSLTTDVVALRFRGRLEVLLVRRGRPPFEGAWALPGGFVEPPETPEEAAARELLEETGLLGMSLETLGVFGAPGRDPRGWVVSAAWLALAPPDCEVRAGSDAADVGWHPLRSLPALAFDHGQIVGAARARLRELTQIGVGPLALLAAPFRTAQARILYAHIWGAKVPPTRFKAWLRRRGAVRRVGPSRFVANDHLRADWLR